MGVSRCGNPYCTCENCGCLSGCQCGTPEQVSMLAVSGSEATLADKIRNTLFAGLISVGLMSTPVVANAVDVKLGSDGGQLVFVPDEVTIKAGESVTWVGNKGMPHNVVFDEDEVPSGADLAALNHEDMVNDEGQKVTSKFDKPGTYPYYCEPHRGAGMNGTVIVKQARVYVLLAFNSVNCFIQSLASLEFSDMTCHDAVTVRLVEFWLSDAGWALGPRHWTPTLQCSRA